jgi:membrane protease YdiL (CAAX protease family)
MLFLGGLGSLFPGLGKSEKDFVGFVIGAVCFQGAAIAWIYFFLRRHGMGWREAFGLSFAGPDLQRALLAGGLAVLVVLPAAFLLGKAAEVLLMRLGVSPELQVAVKLLQQRPPPERLIVYGLGAVFLAPVAEEMLFRGILYPTLKQSGHPLLALWVSSLLFASTHLNLMAFVPLTFLALVLTWLYERTASLMAPMVTHLLFNAVNFALLALQPTWLTLR